jgi:hypothetical protein
MGLNAPDSKPKRANIFCNHWKEQLAFPSLNRNSSLDSAVTAAHVLPLRSRKNRLKGKPHSTILVLTANELTSTFRPTDKWEDLTNEHKALRDFASRDLDHLAEATPQLYVGMDSWHEWFRKSVPRRSSVPRSRRAEQEAEPVTGESPRPKVYLKVSTRLQEVRDFDAFNEIA